MLDTDDVVHAWNRAGNPTPHHRLGLYAQALTADPPATLADLREMPPLALSSYHQLLHDLAREGLGPDGGLL